MYPSSASIISQDFTSLRERPFWSSRVEEPGVSYRTVTERRTHPKDTDSPSDSGFHEDAFPASGASLVQPIDITLNNLLIHNIRIPAPEKVREYLLQHLDMLELTAQLSRALRESFPIPAEISLEHYTSREEDDEHLVVYVRQDSYEDTTLDQINQVVSRYYDQMSDISGWIFATTDYQPPRG